MTAPAPAPVRRRKFPWRSYWFVFAFILVFMAFPIVPVMLAEYTAKANGCVIDEGPYVNPCVVDGRDIGRELDTWSLSGWYIFSTAPFGLVALAIWLIAVIAHRIRWGWARKREATLA